LFADFGEAGAEEVIGFVDLREAGAQGSGIRDQGSGIRNQ
jgi:hypothetical protein